MNEIPAIAAIFPRFSRAQIERFRAECVAAEADELTQMFEIAEVRHAKPSDCILSTSLYCKPHNPEKPPLSPLTLESLQTPHPSVRKEASWWSQYMEPLLASLAQVPPAWTVRIHLAQDLLFLEPWLRHERVEIYVMRHDSYSTVPGMLWRYLPIDDGVTVMARGADALWPLPEIARHVQVALDEGFFLFRHFAPRDLSGGRTLIYKTVTGPLVIDAFQTKLHFTEAAQAWIWHNRHRLIPRTASIPFLGGEVKKFGMSHWARYGQDEQFLSHWLYYLAAERSIYTLCARRGESAIWAADEACVLRASSKSKMVFR